MSFMDFIHNLSKHKLNSCFRKKTLHILGVTFMLFQEEPRTKLVEHCCPGHSEDKQTSTCIPVCSNCFHGFCTAPEQCVCIAGYTGVACNESMYTVVLEPLTLRFKLSPYKIVYIFRRTVPFLAFFCQFFLPERRQICIVKIRTMDEVHLMLVKQQCELQRV